MYSLLTHDRICQHCGKEFVSQKRSTKYCSHRCANLADKARKKTQKQLLKQESAKEARRQDLLQKNFLSITEAAKLLQVSRNTIYILIKKHNISLQRLTARTVRVAQDELYKIRHDVKSPINSTPQNLQNATPHSSPEKKSPKPIASAQPGSFPNSRNTA